MDHEYLMVSLFDVLIAGLRG